MISGRNKYILIMITLAFLSGCVKTVRNGSAVYRDLRIKSDTVWEGTILIEGICTVEAGAVLSIRPGTSIEFVWQDSNNDGIGESGLYVLGTLLARGEKNEPIVFSSGSAWRDVPYGTPRWEGVYFIASEGDPNILLYCKFQNAYRAVHSHFSRVKMENTEVLNNSRGFQFQESEIEIDNGIFSGNYSALRFRDSKVKITNTVFSNNYSAVHSLRSEIIFSENILKNNYLEGIRMKESKGEISNSIVANNRYGILLQGGEITVDNNFVGKNELDGIASNNSKLTAGRNYITRNGLDGVSLNNSEAVLSYNNITGNGKYNLDNTGPLGIEAANNFWGYLNEEEIGKTIEDGKEDPVSGVVIFKPFLSEASGALDMKGE